MQSPVPWTQTIKLSWSAKVPIGVTSTIWQLANIQQPSMMEGSAYSSSWWIIIIMVGYYHHVAKTNIVYIISIANVSYVHIPIVFVNQNNLQPGRYLLRPFPDQQKVTGTTQQRHQCQTRKKWRLVGEPSTNSKLNMELIELEKSMNGWVPCSASIGNSSFMGNSLDSSDHPPQTRAHLVSLLITREYRLTNETGVTHLILLIHQ